MAFNITSAAGVVVSGRGMSSREPWALVRSPLESMLTVAGDAWSEFEHVEGARGDEQSGERVVDGRKRGGWLLDGRWRRVRQWNLRAPHPRFGVGERVRVRYVAATRMVSIVWRGRSSYLAALPATADMAHMRFGVSMREGNSMRVTDASAGASCAHAGGVARHCGTRTQRTTSSHTCESSCAPACCAKRDVPV